MKRTLLLVITVGFLLLVGCKTTETPLPPTPEPTQSPEVYFDAGIELLSQNDLSGAAEQFSLAVEVDPEFGPAFTYLAFSDLWQGLTGEEMLANAQRGADLSAEDGFAAAVLAYAQLSRYYLLDAVSNADHAYQLAPDDAFVAMVFITALTRNYEYERAWEIITQAVPAHPDSPELDLALGAYFTSIGDFGRAMAAYDQAVELDPESVIYLLHQARFYFDARRFNQADTALHYLLDLNPEFLPALVLQAQLEGVYGHFDQAAEVIDQIENLEPDWYFAEMLRGQLAYAAADYQSALEYFTSAGQKTADPVVVDRALIATNLQLEDCASAEQLVNQLNAAYADIVDPIIMRGDLQLCYEDAEHALGDFREALRIDPYNQEAYLGLAQVYQLQGEADSARQAVLSALTLEPASADVHIALAGLLFQQNEISAAEDEARTGIELNPYDIDGHNLLAALLLAQFRVDEALEALEPALALNPAHPVSQRLDGVLLYLNGRPEEALKALEPDADNPSLFLFQGLAERDLGRYADAADSFNTYISFRQDQVEDTTQLDPVWRLLYSMGDDYQLSQQSALNQISEALQTILGSAPDLYFEYRESQGETLVAALTLTLDDYSSESYLFELTAVTLISSEILPRISPVVEGGLEIQVALGTRALYLARLPFDEIKRYADTLYTAEELVDHLAFDLADSAVQRASIDQILREVAELRDLDYVDIPEYVIINQGEVGGYFTDNFDQEYIESLGNEYAAVALLGLIPEDLSASDLMMDFISSSVSGFYSTGDEKIYIVAGDRMTSSDQLTIVHESEHAIADQEFNLNYIRARTTDGDRYQAATALIEGDAELLSVQYLHEVVPEIGWWTDLPETVEEPTEDWEDYPSYLINISLFPYIYGRDFVSFLYERGGWREVNSAMWEPPSSSEQIMHPQRYLDEDKPQRVYLDDPSEELPGSWELVDQDVMGEYGVYLTLSEYFGSAAAASAAEGWGGDRYILLERRGGSDLILAWRIAWDSPAEAEQFWTFLTTAMFHRVSYREVVDDFSQPADTRLWSSPDGLLLMTIKDDQVTILIGDDRADLETVLSALD